jgi:hypothetical protein
MCVGGGLSEGQTRQFQPNLVVLMVELLLLVMGSMLESAQVTTIIQHIYEEEKYKEVRFLLSQLLKCLCEE